MKIQCLDPLGINSYEREANEKLEASLPNNWKAYSSLEMRGRQSKEFEGDLILIMEKFIQKKESGLYSFQMDVKSIVVMVCAKQEDLPKY